MPSICIKKKKAFSGFAELSNDPSKYILTGFYSVQSTGIKYAAESALVLESPLKVI